MKENNLINHLGSKLQNEIDDYALHDDDTLECLTLEREELSTSFLNELSKNVKIRRLFISKCNLQSTDFLQDLINLTELEIIECNMPPIKPLNLPNLHKIHIYDSGVQSINFLKGCINLKEIILPVNNIENITALSRFKDLDILILSSNKIKDICSLKDLKIGIHIELSNNKILDFSPLYNSLRNNTLKSLSIINNPSFFPPQRFGYDEPIDILNWFEEKYDEVRRLIKDAYDNKLEILDLGSLGITDLSIFPQLFELTSLKELILSNEWASYNDDIDDWVREVSDNNLYFNNLMSIPTSISKLRNLEILILGGDWNDKDGDNPNKWRITKIENITKLKKLRFLNISNNKITNIDSIKNLTNLNILHANNNLITSIKSLEENIELLEIYLSNNLINDIEFIISNKNLNTVDLHSNTIKDLIPLKQLFKENKIGIEVTSWKKGTISINKNKYLNPPIEVLMGGRESFLLYVEQYEKEMSLKLQEYINNDVKIIFAGNSNSGKSTLLNYFVTNKVDKKIKSTHWLETVTFDEKINNSKVKLNFFDLGGQDYYHDTHNLFFDSDSIYIVLWEDQSNKLSDTNNNLNLQTFPLEYWLDCIRIHSKNYNSEMETKINVLLDKREKEMLHTGNLLNSAGSTKKINEISNKKNILIVQNKTEINQVFLNQSNYEEKYKSVKDFFNISLYENKGLIYLKESFIDLVKENANYNRRLLYTWGIIKDNFKDIAGNKDITLSVRELRSRFNSFIENYFTTTALTIEEVKSLMFTNEEIKNILRFLNNVGQVIYSPNIDDELVIVDQKKFIENTKAILLDAKENHGKIKNGGDDYFINVLTDLKIIFEDGGNYFFPLYLPENPYPVVDILLNNKIIPVRKFRFDGYIPKNIIIKLFSEFSKKNKVHSKSNNFYFWRNGLIFVDDISKEKFCIKFYTSNNSEFTFIDFFCLNGQQKFTSSEEVLDIIIKIFDSNNLNYTELITVDGESYADIFEVILFYKEGRNFIEVSNSEGNNKKIVKTYTYNNFLTNDLKINMKKLFISYSKYDEDYKTEFIKHLITLKDDGLIDEFNCESIDLGENSLEVIQKNLEDCDYMISLVSVDYLNTEYIRKYEVKRAIELDKKIIPIIIKPCDWENSMMKDFHATLRGTNISLDKQMFLMDKIKETSSIERNQNWTKIIKEFRSKLFN